jgi:hypothetical protein
MEDDEIFVKIVELLQKNNINYWICHGTLLGVIRENKLLPWDHDIDFAVWADEVTKDKILEIFINSGFKQEILMDEFDNLFFSTKGKRIDINFYRRNKDIAFTKWVSPTENSFFIKLAYFIISEICYNLNPRRFDDSKGLYYYDRLILSRATSALKPFISNNIKILLKKWIAKNLKYTGYSYSNELMKFKLVPFLGIKVSVPIDSEKYLATTYGEDWKVPNKNYIWFNEAKNLHSHNG